MLESPEGRTELVRSLSIAGGYRVSPIVVHAYT